MPRDRAGIVQLTFLMGLNSALEACATERRLFSTSMLPLICGAVVALGSLFLDVRITVLLSAILMIVMAGIIVETSPGVEQKSPVYLSFFISGALILGFAVLHDGASALMDAPMAIIPIIAFFLFGGSSLVGLVRFLGHM